MWDWAVQLAYRNAVFRAWRGAGHHINGMWRMEKVYGRNHARLVVSCDHYPVSEDESWEDHEISRNASFILDAEAAVLSNLKCACQDEILLSYKNPVYLRNFNYSHHVRIRTDYPSNLFGESKCTQILPPEVQALCDLEFVIGGE